MMVVPLSTRGAASGFYQWEVIVKILDVVKKLKLHGGSQAAEGRTNLQFLKHRRTRIKFMLLVAALQAPKNTHKVLDIQAEDFSRKSKCPLMEKCSFVHGDCRWFTLICFGHLQHISEVFVEISVQLQLFIGQNSLKQRSNSNSLCLNNVWAFTGQEITQQISKCIKLKLH